MRAGSRPLLIDSMASRRTTNRGIPHRCRCRPRNICRRSQWITADPYAARAHRASGSAVTCRYRIAVKCGRTLSGVPNEEFALHVLFVCTGNICRSPTAERLAAAYGARLQVPDFRASSAGTRAVIAHPIHHDAALVVEKLGGEVSNFAARQLTPRIASDADLVLTMTRKHRDTVLELAAHQLHRTFTLSEAARLASDCNARNIAELAALRPHVDPNEPSDIPDPIGQSKDFFSMIGSRIADLLPPILELCRPE
jgi:protein-tyrosine phosphatase